MPRKYFVSGIVSGVVIAAAAIVALAQTGSVVFPVAELGGCASKEECRVYCDIADHARACLDFAAGHRLISEDEAAKARALLATEGPGGCLGVACKVYCDNAAHRDECYAFAKARGLISKEKAAAFDKEKASLKKTSGPGGCATHAVCAAYCADQSHMNECLEFGTRSGLITRDEAVTVKKLSGQGPGGCRGALACREYCEAESHATECLNFAQDNGLMANDTAERARRLLQATGPGGCRGVECKVYCEDPSQRDACRAFAKTHKLIPEEAVKKNTPSVQQLYPPKLQGPGGCDTAQSCYEYCAKSEAPAECAKAFRRPLPDTATTSIEIVPTYTTPPMRMCAGDACQEVPVGSGSQPVILPASESGNESAVPPPPVAGSREELLQYIRDNCAKYGGTWDGSICKPAAIPLPVQSEENAAPTSRADSRSFLGTILDMIIWLFGNK